MSPTPQITPAESARLAELEKTIEQGQLAWLETGLALTEIRDGKLYRSEFSTFKEYCESKWGWTDKRAYQLIQASEETSTTGRHFETEREARAARKARISAQVSAIADTKPAPDAEKEDQTSTGGRTIEPEKTSPPPRDAEFLQAIGIQTARNWFARQVEDIAAAIMADATDEQLDASILQWEVELRKLRTTKNNRRLKSA